MAGMSPYPPHARDVLAVFLRWMGEEGRRAFEVERQPDEENRNERTCDYVCVEALTGGRIAVEVTSMWRSEQAGAEDASWSKWQSEIARLLAGRVPGEFHVATPLAVTKSSPADQAADDLLRLVHAVDWDAVGDRQVPAAIAGLDCWVGRWAAAGSAVEFARFAPSDGFEGAAGEFLGAISAYKSEQLARWKQGGWPTYLLVYNTYWTLQSHVAVQKMVDALPRAISENVDHLVVISGNVPDDAWCRRYRLPA